MAATITGEFFKFGFIPATAPSGLTGFVAREGEFRILADVFAPATDGNGAVEAIQMNDKTKRKIEGSFTGYATTGLTHAVAKTAVQSGILSADLGSGAQPFIIKTIRISKKKGEFVAVTVEGIHYPILTTTATNANVP